MYFSVPDMCCSNTTIKDFLDLEYENMVFAISKGWNQYRFVIRQDTVAVIIVAALMHKAAGGSVLWIAHAGAFAVCFPVPFPVPAYAAIFCQDCFSRPAIPGRSLSFSGTRCKGRFSLW
jgi:hypothetical protein